MLCVKGAEAERRPIQSSSHHTASSGTDIGRSEVAEDINRQACSKVIGTL